MSGSRDGRSRAPERTWSVNSRAVRSTSARLSRHVSATARRTSEKAGIPCRASGGKYVPPKNGSPAGVMKTVIGHPPCPDSATTASMYTASRSGRSSRSTFTFTNRSFMIRAVAASSNDSRSMTWHQWHAA